jgi:predicted AlkP superfamily pyrophosphatase or phosphodiesterase
MNSLRLNPALLPPLLLATVSGLSASGSWAESTATRTERWPTQPKLILTLVIDQFRPDSLTRFQSRFLPARDAKGNLGGFNALLQRAAYYPHGEYTLLQAMTGPGHATVLSGANPGRMGIPTNYWFDAELNQPLYCAADFDHQTVGAPMKKKNVGTSPKNLVGTTVGDELKNSGHPSRMVSIAVKDRAAILMGGHRADLAVWMDGDATRWVTSTFYAPDKKLPDWVEAANAEIDKLRGKKLLWELSGTPTGRSTDDPMVLQNEWNLRIGKDFPHAATYGSKASLNLPIAADLTVDLASRALDAYGLGRGKATDLLAVSFSVHDYVAHAFGPNSREIEEMTVHEDRALSKLLNALQKKVPGGLSNVLFVLTADHAGPNNPDWLVKHRTPAGRIDETTLKARLEERLVESFGRAPKDQAWIVFLNDFGVWLNLPALAAKNLSRELFEDRTRELLLTLEPKLLLDVLTTSRLESHRNVAGGATLVARQHALTHFKGRSPHLVLLARPFVQQSDDTVSHLTGYAYDRTVPILLGGPGIRPGLRPEKAQVIDIAPTLSWLLGITPPASSDGRVLAEAIQPLKAL